jgi:hypothetical protein
MTLTLVPVSWGAPEETPEHRPAIAYSVVGLPHCRRAIIAERPGGWTIVTEELIAHSWGVSYRSPEEALDALKAYVEHASDQ